MLRVFICNEGKWQHCNQSKRSLKIFVVCQSYNKTEDMNVSLPHIRQVVL